MVILFLKCVEIISLKETLIWLYDVGKNLQFNFCYLLIWFFYVFGFLGLGFYFIDFRYI